MSADHITLERACSLVTDGTHYTPPDNGGGIPFLTVKDMTPQGLDFALCAKISQAEYEKARAGNSAPRAGDVLFSKDGTVGKVHVVQEKRDFAVLSSIAILRPDPKKADSQYLGYILKDPQILAQTSRKKTGTALRRIILGDLKQIRFRLPPLPEQRRIAAILDKADEIRRKAVGRLDDLGSLRQSLFLRMVGSHNREWTSWPESKIYDLAAAHKSSMRTGPFGSALKHSEFTESGIAVLGIDNAVQNEFAWGERRYISEDKYAALRRYRVFPKDVIITIMGTTGRSAVVPENLPEAISTKHLATITVDESKAAPEFISHAVHTEPDIDRQIRQATRGAIMSGLNLGIIKELVLRVPPLSQQKRYVAALTRLGILRSRMRVASEEAERLFLAASQEAFSS